MDSDIYWRGFTPGDRMEDADDNVAVTPRSLPPVPLLGLRVAEDRGFCGSPPRFPILA